MMMRRMSLGRPRDSAWLARVNLMAVTLAPSAVPDNLSVIAAIEQLRRADSGQRKAWAVALVSGQYDSLPPALVPFLGAALQLAWTHWLLQLELSDLREREDQTLCPCCGAPPMAGVIRHRGQLNAEHSL